MVKKVKRGDLVQMSGIKCLITTSRDGSTGTAIYLNPNKGKPLKDEFFTIYYEKQDLEKAKRLKVSQVPKKLAEKRKQFLKYLR